MTTSIIDDTLCDIQNCGVVAVVRASTAQRAHLAIEALITNGITGIEVTFTTPNAEEVIADCVTRWGSDALIGAGTITASHQASLAAEAGARFLVSPGSDENVVSAMRETGLVTMPGALTPTEVMVATRLGAHVIKVFPGSLVGPSYLSALRGPFPELRLMPTGGVSVDNMSTWFAKGAFAVGAGGDLVPSNAVETGDVEEIGRRARAFAAARHEVAGSVAK